MVRILAADGLEQSAKDALIAKGFEVVDKHFEADELGKALADFDAVLVRSATKIRVPVIDEMVAAGRCRLVIRGGVGVDNIDVAYAKEKGITVRNTPAASSASVAELALGHMFALARFIGIANYTMRNGKWDKKQYQGIELGGRTLGVIGMGRIGRELAARATALGMNVIYNDVFGAVEALPYRFATFEEVLKEADFLSLHVPAQPENKPLLAAEQLAMMKPTAYIINTARGSLIDNAALCDALDNGTLAGAALDVYPEEPCKDERLLANPKVSLTPHIGAATAEAQQRIGAEIVSIISEFFA
ncbi:MAG: D-2-hydroxyacid dehydrogenase [Firmicutes bacterium]|nr:D-2-hydroxyacid dehydrogenase [Bacillota bacterium]